MTGEPNSSTRAAKVRRVRCSRRQDLSAGMLNAEERATWTGPPIADARRESLPAQMDLLHFHGVERSVFGLLRCHVREDRVECLLFNRWPALLFHQPQTAMEPLRVTRNWVISGGFLARGGLTAFGTITFGWSAVDAGGVQNHEIWVKVDGYPSRFLALPSQRGPKFVWRVVGSMYAWYHGTVSCRYLRQMARWMGAAT